MRVELFSAMVRPRTIMSSMAGSNCCFMSSTSFALIVVGMLTISRLKLMTSARVVPDMPRMVWVSDCPTDWVSKESVRDWIESLYWSSGCLLGTMYLIALLKSSCAFSWSLVFEGGIL